MSEQLTWDDLRTVRAVMRGGSLSAAARALDLSHATVYRRLGAIEARLGVRLFTRARTGYTPTAAGEELSALAEEVEVGVVSVERRIMGRDLRPSGRLRVATTDTLLLALLTPMLARFRKLFPDIELEVVASNEMANLTRRDADVAIRAAPRPPETLVGRKVADVAWAVYASRRHPAARAAPSDLAAFEWIGPDESLSNVAVAPWMSRQGLFERARYRTNTFLGARDAVEAGIGLAVLPCFVGESRGGVVRITRPIPELTSELWLLTHPDLRTVGRVRAFLDFMAGAIAARRSFLAGRRGGAGARTAI